MDYNEGDLVIIPHGKQCLYVDVQRVNARGWFADLRLDSPITGIVLESVRWTGAGKSYIVWSDRHQRKMFIHERVLIPRF